MLSKSILQAQELLGKQTPTNKNSDQFVLDPRALLKRSKNILEFDQKQTSRKNRTPPPLTKHSKKPTGETQRFIYENSCDNENIVQRTCLKNNANTKNEHFFNDTGKQFE